MKAAVEAVEAAEEAHLGHLLRASTFSGLRPGIYEAYLQRTPVTLISLRLI